MIVLNGQAHDFDAGITVRDMLAQLGLPDRGVAVAVDGAVLPKGRWHEGLPDGAQVDVVTAVQGG